MFVDVELLKDRLESDLEFLQHHGSNFTRSFGPEKSNYVEIYEHSEAPSKMVGRASHLQLKSIFVAGYKGICDGLGSELIDLVLQGLFIGEEFDRIRGLA